jgi:hypothetical protein
VSPAAAPDLLRRRLSAQGLAGAPLGHGPDGPVAVARRLLAIQAQDPRGARLAIRARSRATTAADVDRGLTQARSLVVTWLNRGTLHLVTREDYPLLQALLPRWQRTGVDTRLARSGIDAATAERAVGILDRALADTGPLPRAALRERLLTTGVPAEGQALIYVLFRASLDGVLVRGPVRGGEHLYARVADWLPEAARDAAAIAADPEPGYAEIARRFLAGHGPADARDLAKWLGVPLGVARQALAVIADQLMQRPDGLLALAARRPQPPGRLPPPRLLGAFEPVLMGWRSRAHVLGEHESEVVTGGVFRGFALVRGRAVGVWRVAGSGVALAPCEALSTAVSDALQRDGRAVLRFLGR